VNLLRLKSWLSHNFHDSGGLAFLWVNHLLAFGHGHTVGSSWQGS